ncbi:hypothetical protein L1987_72178 [Smallanthus sonchifolius]|uniref:Uncharacterized protein n=1 Tax=Smallanthus sonchifolius TaxID=185202 RepID=A0ACB9ATX3_9ASTR|nr:hypothetical protein L1987_72178 [Smallanthus sonchifolius]
MWNANSTAVDSQDEDESWEVKAFAEDTGNAMGTTWPPRSYTCTFCRREFRSAQALGGHMNVHRRDRARLHQPQPNNFKNPNSLIPSEELVAADAGLCLLFSLAKPNAIFKPSSVAPHSLNYSLNNSSKIIGASTSIDHKSNQRVGLHDNTLKKTDLAVEGIDLELRLGCSSSAS